MNTKIWRFDVGSGSWAFVRNCFPNKAKAKLERIRSEKPGETYVVSRYRPKDPPRAVST